MGSNFFKNNKSIALGLFLVVSLGLVACSDDSSESDGVVTIEMAGHDNQDYNETKVKRFNDNHDDIQIEYNEMVPGSDDQFTQFSTWLSSENETPDILMVDAQWPSQFAASEWITPIDEYIEGEDDDYLDRFWDAAVDVGEYEDELYGIQARMDVGMMYYREDLLDKHDQDVPETWEEVIKVSKAIQKEENNDDLDGYLFQGDQIEGATINWLENLWGLGAEVQDDEENLVVNTPEGVQALEKMQDLIYKDKISPVSVSTANPDENNKVFGQGDAIFQRNWTFAFESLDKTEVEGKYGVANIPHFEGEEGHPNNGDRLFTINAFSEHKDEAWEAIKYFLSDEEQALMVSEAGYIPAVQSVANDPEVQKDQPILADMQEILENSKNRPSIRNYEEFSQIMQPQINAVLSNEDVNPEEALDTAQQEIDEKMEQ